MLRLRGAATLVSAFLLVAPAILASATLAVLPLATMTLGTAALVAGCGTGSGTATALPPGPPTSAPPGNRVLYVAMARGDRIEAYRLGTDGLLPEEPFSVINVENPRRLHISNGVLYASIVDSVLSFKLGADGRLPAAPTASTEPILGYNPFEILRRDDKLYVAAAGLERLDQYDLTASGQVERDPATTSRGDTLSQYVTMDITDRFLYAGAPDTAEVNAFLLNPDGTLPARPEPQEPSTFVFNPDDLQVVNGVLYVTSASGGTIRAYIVQDDGTIAPIEDSETGPENFYRELLVVGDRLYASAFNFGRVDVYPIETIDGVPGMLAENGPIAVTAGDTASFPLGLFHDSGILYVAKAGLDRVDAYVLDGNGLPPSFPSSSTNMSEGGFPLDIEILELP